MKRHPDTQELVQQAQKGNQKALDSLFARTYHAVLQAARSYLRRCAPGLRSRVETQDLAQSACHDAVRALSRYRDAGTGSFRLWLNGILRNKLRRRLSFFGARRRAASLEAPLESAARIPASTPGPLGVLINEDEKARLEDALRSLPERHRRVITCRYHEGLPWDQVGATLGLSEEAAQMLCHRALLKLRRAFESPR